eukprot:95409_1
MVFLDCAKIFILSNIERTATFPTPFTNSHDFVTFTLYIMGISTSSSNFIETQHNQCDEKSCDSISSKSLQKMKFPENFDAIYKTIPNYEQQLHYTQEKIMKGEKDRRACYDTNESTAYSRIGQLRMVYIYNNKKYKGYGTATIFHNNPKTGRIYAITCGHNLIHHHAMSSTNWTAETMWFERRLTNNYKIYSSSKSVKQYAVDKTWIHPQYDPEKKICAFDLAIISFIDYDQYFTKHLENMNVVKTFSGYHTQNIYADRVQKAILTNADATDLHFFKSLITSAMPYSISHCGYSLFGYPVDKQKNGQLWGEQITIKEAKEKILDVRKDGEMIAYTIHTDKGQSGSAIVHSNNGSFKIVAVHTTGSSSENCGVILTENKMNWITECVKQIEHQTNSKNITDNLAIIVFEKKNNC